MSKSKADAIGPNSKNTKCGVTVGSDGDLYGAGLPGTTFSIEGAGGKSRGRLSISYGGQSATIGLMHFSEAFETKVRQTGMHVGEFLEFYTPQVAEGLSVSQSGHNWHQGCPERKAQHRGMLALPAGWTVEQDGQFHSFRVAGVEVARLFRFLASETRYDSVMGSSSPVGALLMQSQAERRADKLRLKKAKLDAARKEVAKLEKEVADLTPQTRTKKASK